MNGEVSGNTRPIAICVIRRGDEILVFEAHDTRRNLTYCRPLGGGLRFREPSVEAVRRELREEIGAELVDVRLLTVLESTFELEGVPSHEIVFVYEGSFADPSLYGRDAFEVVEETERLRATWRPIDSFDMTTSPLYPSGLLDLLRHAYGTTSTDVR